MHRFSHDTAAFCLAVLTAGLSACGGGGGGSPGTLTVSTNSLTFTANDAATPPAQTISGTVTGVSGGTLYITVVGSGAAIQSISPVNLISNTTGEAAVFVPSPASLGPGAHMGTVAVRACKNSPACATGNLDGSPQTVSVTYNVNGLESSADALNYSIDSAAVAGDFELQATVSGHPAQNWAAAADVPWLTVTANGATGTAMTASLVQGVLDGMTNGTYTGTVTITPGAAGQPVGIPVSLELARAQVSYVSPYVAYTGTSGDVIIRGEELSQVSADDVLFGATPASSFTIVSPTEIHATHPAMAAGRHAVHLQVAAGDVRELAELVVVDAPAFSATTLAYPDGAVDSVSALVYDAERAALGVSGYSNGPTAFIHFPSVSSVWQTPVAKPLFNHFALVLSADGAEWVAGNYRAVAHLDADDLSTLATVTSPLDPNGQPLLAQFALASDGSVAMFSNGCGSEFSPLSFFLYDVRKRTFDAHALPRCQSRVGASGDGSLLLAVDPVTNDDVVTLDTSSGAATPTGIDLLTQARPALNRTGSRFVLDGTKVYDGSYAHLGDLPGTTEAVVLHPDGTRAYAYDQSGLMRSYDLTASPVAGIFPEIGSGITLAGDPGPNAPAFGGTTVMMAITPDGETVFIAGGQAVIVQPTP